MPAYQRHPPFGENEFQEAHPHRSAVVPRRGLLAVVLGRELIRAQALVNRLASAFVFLFGIVVGPLRRW
jgi:hypothetical protein